MRPKSSIVRTMAFVALVLVIVPSIQAQTQPQQNPPAGQPKPFVGGGPNPFVGGGPHPFVGGVNQNPWFTNPQVSQHLQLNDQQAGQLSKAYQDAWTVYNQGYNNMDKGLNDVQRQQRMQELQQNFHKDFGAAPDNFLKDRAQRERYNQLYWQHRGYSAFADPTIAKSLNLTPTQRGKLDLYQQNWLTQMNKLDPLYRSNRAQAEQQFNLLQGEYSKGINNTLTSQQQEAWRQMTGNPYAFSPDVFFRPNDPAPANPSK